MSSCQISFTGPVGCCLNDVHLCCISMQTTGARVEDGEVRDVWLLPGDGRQDAGGEIAAESYKEARTGLCLGFGSGAAQGSHGH